MNEDLIDALLKKAKGYEAKEVVDEFVVDESNLPVLSKRKVTYKDVPPDLGAVKAIAELAAEKEYRSLSTEELLREKRRLLKELESGN
ncbi:MAG: hypothetical protein LBT20_02100 [Clostridiales bacterium]|jgi:hypothetical protein|nr:hypothetical protein [Clostridiales bacterium]